MRCTARVARSSKLRRGLVTSEEDEGTFAVQIQSPLQSRKQRQKCLSKASDGSAPVGDEVTAAPEKKLQFGELFLAWLELAEVRSHPRLVGDDVGISGIGFGFTAVSVTGSVYGEARDVEDPLVSLPQQRQQRRRATSWLI
jgi:hypothetical protein